MVDYLACLNYTRARVYIVVICARVAVAA